MPTQQYGEFREAAQYPPDRQLIDILPHTRHVIRAVTERATRMSCIGLTVITRATSRRGAAPSPAIGARIPAVPALRRVRRPHYRHPRRRRRREEAREIDSDGTEEEQLRSLVAGTSNVPPVCSIR